MIPFLIVFCSIVLIVISALIAIKISKKRKFKLVTNSSLCIKKLNELNEKFPNFSVSYNHCIKETIYLKNKRSYDNFKPSNIFDQKYQSVIELRKRKEFNHRRFMEYLSLFNKTVKECSMNEESIAKTGLKPKTFRKYELMLIKKNLLRSDDKAEVYLKITKKYTSPAGRNSYSYTYEYREERFSLRSFAYSKANVDYSPIPEEILKSKEEKEAIEREKQRKAEEERALDSIAPAKIVVNGITYSIDNGRASVAEVAIDLIEISIPTFINFRKWEFKVCSISTNAFEHHTKLERVALPEGVEEIPENAFSGCVRLKEISLPSTLKTIGKKAFNDCELLEVLDIPSGVNYIGREAFSMCQSLKKVRIPCSVSMVEESVFWMSENVVVEIEGQSDENWNANWNPEKAPVVRR